MDLSFISVNHHSSGVLAACLESIDRTVCHLEYEIIVVNNSPSDRGLAEVLASRPNIRLLENPVNAGFGKASNQGAAAARGRTLVFLNPDTKLTPDAVERLHGHLLAHPEIGVLAPKVLNTDGSLQYSCRRFPTLWTGLFNRYSLLSHLFPANRFTTRYLMKDFDHNVNREVDWVSGCFMMIPRTVFEAVGGFDETYFLFNEDVDLCRTAKDRGYAVVYFPEARVVHHIGSSGGRVSARVIIERHRGMKHYFKKHHRDAGRVPGRVVESLIGARCLSQLFFNMFR